MYMQMRLSKKKSFDLNNIGDRIRYLRALIGLDRNQMNSRHQINLSSLEKWENGKANITPKNIARLIDIALEHSIECIPEWLMNGEGSPPKTISMSSLKEQPSQTQGEAENFLKDIGYFKNSYPNNMTAMISDDAMSPMFLIGDFVGGKVVSLEKLKDYLDCACIVETSDGKIRLRRIGYNMGSWYLYGTHIRHKGSPLIEPNVQIVKAAPVFWHRIKI